MKLDHIITSPKGRKRRVGRGPGSGRGKTSGRGNNGQFQRTGAKRNPSFSGGALSIIRKIPKRGMSKGSRQIMMRHDKFKYTCINLERLNIFENNAEITKESLMQKGLIRIRSEKVKILGDGKIEKTLFVKCDAFSKTAKKKIEEKSGKVEIITSSEK